MAVQVGVKLEPIAIGTARARVERRLRVDTNSVTIVDAAKGYDVLGPVIAISLLYYLQYGTKVGYSSYAYTCPITIGTLAACIMLDILLLPFVEIYMISTGRS